MTKFHMIEKRFMASRDLIYFLIGGNQLYWKQENPRIFLLQMHEKQRSLTESRFANCIVEINFLDEKNLFLIL